MKAIILSTSKFKEKDGIIDAISEKGYITFKAHGILDPKNKNAAINMPLVEADLTFSDKSKTSNMILKESKVLHVPLKASIDLEYLSYLSLLGEVTKTLLSDSEKGEIYKDLHQVILAYKKQEDKKLIILKYLSVIFAHSGFALNVNECIRCGSKTDIVMFSFIEGGFICRNCLDKEDVMELSKDQMLLLRKIVNYDNYDFSNWKVDENDSKYLLHKFFEFIYNSYGYKVKSLDAIN